MLESIAALLSPVTDPMAAVLRPYYLYIKFVHVFFIMIWSWSTAVAYMWYVRVGWMRWERAPDDPAAKKLRDWTMEQLDRGVMLEHVAFPVIIVTGLLLFISGGWSVSLDPAWLLVKLVVVAFVFVPIELVDYWLSHFGGNKPRLRKAGEWEKYERYMEHHWLFLRIVTPIIFVFIPMTIFLAIVKPF